MKKLYFIFLLLCTAFAFSQSINNQQVLYGRLISDTLKVSNAIVLNKTTKQETRTSSDGSFNILAQPKDTLYFNHANIVTMQYVVEQVDFVIDLKIEVYPKSTMLEEIMVYKFNLSGVLKHDVVNTKVYDRNLKKEIQEMLDNYNLDEESYNSRTLVNELDKVMPSAVKVSDANVDFMKIGKAIFKKKNKSKFSDKLHNQVYISLGKENIAQHLAMSKTELDIYIQYLISEQGLTAKKIDSLDSLQLLEYLAQNKNNYHNHLLEKK